MPGRREGSAECRLFVPLSSHLPCRGNLRAMSVFGMGQRDGRYIYVATEGLQHPANVVVARGECYRVIGVCSRPNGCFALRLGARCSGHRRVGTGLGAPERATLGGSGRHPGHAGESQQCQALRLWHRLISTRDNDPTMEDDGNTNRPYPLDEWRARESELIGQGVSVSATHHRIGADYGVSRSTVRRYLVQGESARRLLVRAV